MALSTVNAPALRSYGRYKLNQQSAHLTPGGGANTRNEHTRPASGHEVARRAPQGGCASGLKAETAASRRTKARWGVWTRLTVLVWFFDWRRKQWGEQKHTRGWGAVRGKRGGSDETGTRPWHTAAREPCRRCQPDRGFSSMQTLAEISHSQHKKRHTRASCSTRALIVIVERGRDTTGECIGHLCALSPHT